jgi:hypothetical protein
MVSAVVGRRREKAFPPPQQLPSPLAAVLSLQQPYSFCHPERSGLRQVKRGMNWDMGSLQHTSTVSLGNGPLPFYNPLLFVIPSEARNLLCASILPVSQGQLYRQFQPSLFPPDATVSIFEHIWFIRGEGICSALFLEILFDKAARGGERRSISPTEPPPKKAGEQQSCPPAHQVRQSNESFPATAKRSP